MQGYLCGVFARRLHGRPGLPRLDGSHLRARHQGFETSDSGTNSELFGSDAVIIEIVFVFRCVCVCMLVCVSLSMTERCVRVDTQG